MTEREDLMRLINDAFPLTPLDHQRAALARSARLWGAWAAFWRVMARAGR